MNRGFSTAPFSDLNALQARAAVFDVDYTILKHSSTIAFAKTAIRNKLLHPLQLLASAKLHVQARLGLANSENLPRHLPFLEGMSRELLDELAEEVFLRYMVKGVYPEAIALIRELQSRGCLVILATASLDFLISPLAAFLHIPASHVLTTHLGYEKGLCTGRVLGKHCIGLEKLHRAAALLKDRRIPNSSAAFFTDSIMDLGMMNRVGYPVATNPDVLLHMKAKRNGWEILRFR